jgi:hypothetical protein
MKRRSSSFASQDSESSFVSGSLQSSVKRYKEEEEDERTEIDKLSPSEISDIIEELRGAPDGVESKIGNQKIRTIIAVMTAWWSATPSTSSSLIDHAASRWGKCQDGKTIQEKLDTSTLTSVDLRYVYNREMFKRIRLDSLLRQRGFLETAGVATPRARARQRRALSPFKSRESR